MFIEQQPFIVCSQKRDRSPVSEKIEEWIITSENTPPNTARILQEDDKILLPSETPLDGAAACLHRRAQFSLSLVAGVDPETPGSTFYNVVPCRVLQDMPRRSLHNLNYRRRIKCRRPQITWQNNAVSQSFHRPRITTCQAECSLYRADSL